jgi:hypothetical protein
MANRDLNYSDIKARLNNAKIVSPLISAIIATHGPEIGANFQNAFVELGSHLEKQVEKVLKSISPNGSTEAITATTQVSLSNLMADAWKNNPGLSNYDFVSAGYLSLIEYLKPDPGMVFNNSMPRATSSSLAEARACSKILPTVFRLEKIPVATRRLFLSNLGINEFVTKCRDHIKELAQKAADRIAPDDDTQNNMAYRSALNCLSEIYAETIAQQYLSLNKELHNIRSDSQKCQDYMAKVHKSENGILLDYVQPQMNFANDILYPCHSGMNIEDEISPAAN